MEFDEMKKHDNNSVDDVIDEGISEIEAPELSESGETVENGEVDRKKSGSHISANRNWFDIAYLSLCSVYIFVMWCCGFNFLPLIADVLGIVAGLLIFIRTITNKNIGLYLWISYLVIMGGLFIFFLIWGAESFGKNLWWNFVLVLFPILLSIFVYICNRFIGKKSILKLTCALCSFLMAGTALIYVFFMNLRLRPTVEDLQAGHDEYLNSVKNRYKTDANSPNVLVILMDDMAYSDISAYSYLGSKAATINTPNIDSIAENGIMMDNFYSASPVCSPSRFSILTGRYSSRGYLDNVVFPSDIQSDPWSPTHFINPYQFLNNVDGILGDEITFAEVLQNAGYRTGCIGKWNLGDYGQYLPTSQGFDYFYGSYYVNDMTPYNWVRDCVDEDGNFTSEVVRSHKENLDQSESTQKFTDEVIDFIQSSVDSNEKFFAYYTSPWPHYPIFSNDNGKGKGDTSDDTYIACIEEFDKYLGNILDVLKKNGVYDDTLIVFSSDNGPGREGVTGSLRGRKNTTFDGGMKVPLIASYPAGGVGTGDKIESVPFEYFEWVQDEEGRKVKSEIPTAAMTKHIDASAMNFDLFTTILRYCGIVEDGGVYLPQDRIIDGADLYNLWNCTVGSSERVHDKLFYQKRGKCQAIQMPVEVNGKVYDFKYYDSVRTENSAFIDQMYKNYLFNLDLDPAEGYSVSKTHPEVARMLLAELKNFRDEMKKNRRGIIKN